MLSESENLRSWSFWPYLPPIFGPERRASWFLHPKTALVEFAAEISWGRPLYLALDLIGNTKAVSLLPQAGMGWMGLDGLKIGWRIQLRSQKMGVPMGTRNTPLRDGLKMGNHPQNDLAWSDLVMRWSRSGPFLWFPNPIISITSHTVALFTAIMFSCFPSQMNEKYLGWLVLGHYTAVLAE